MAQWEVWKSPSESENVEAESLFIGQAGTLTFSFKQGRVWIPLRIFATGQWVGVKLIEQ